MPLLRRLIYAAYFRLRHPGPTRRTPHVTPLCSRRTTTIGCYHSPLGDTRLASPRLSPKRPSPLPTVSFSSSSSSSPRIPHLFGPPSFGPAVMRMSAIPPDAVSVVSTFARHLPTLPLFSFSFFFLSFFFFSESICVRDMRRYLLPNDVASFFEKSLRNASPSRRSFKWIRLFLLFFK